MTLPRLSRPRLGITVLTVISAIFVATVDSAAFWTRLFEAVDVTTIHRLGFVVAVFIVLVAWLTLVFSLFGVKYLFKPLLIVTLLGASAASYFMDQNGVVIDSIMIRNIAETNYNEATELLNGKLLLHLMLTGVLPALLVAAVTINYRSFLRETLTRVATIAVAVVVVAGGLFAFYQDFSMVGREHAELRLYINPTYPLHSVGKYLIASNRSHELVAVGVDAHQRQSAANSRHSLLVVVVGETARASEFSLNSYARPTNVELSREDVVSFRNVSSCGTSTAVSVPCMFSGRGKQGFDGDGDHFENLLDVLAHAGIEVLWRDNNAGCKGVCARVASQQISEHTNPALCHAGECFDEELLTGLSDYLAGVNHDAVVVLHQMGSHGPAYYLRHPAKYTRFTPECAVTNVQDCSTEMLVNAYDNTIAYTDHFLAEVIRLLKQSSDKFDTAMLYVSDHGESLGEHGLYLHGLPYAMAPEQQTNVPMVLWLSEDLAERARISKDCLASHRDNAYSHDNLFHSVLGVMDVETGVYRPQLDLFATCRIS